MCDSARAHSLHDGLGARHVEGHLVEVGDFLQSADVVGDHRVIGAEHQAKLAGLLQAALHARLVEVGANRFTPYDR